MILFCSRYRSTSFDSPEPTPLVDNHLSDDDEINFDDDHFQGYNNLLNDQNHRKASNESSSSKSSSSNNGQPSKHDLLLNLSLEDNEDSFDPFSLKSTHSNNNQNENKVEVGDLFGDFQVPLPPPSNVAASSNNLPKSFADDLLWSSSSILDQSKILPPTKSVSIGDFNGLNKNINSSSSNNNNVKKSTTPTNQTASKTGKADPFGDFSAFLNFSSNDTGSRVGSSSSTTATTPVGPTAVPASNNNIPRTTPTQPFKPDYRRSNFGDLSSGTPGSSNGTGLKGPKVVGNEFEDLLGGTGFNVKRPDAQPKSISAMMKKDLVGFFFSGSLFEGSHPFVVSLSSRKVV